MEQLPSTETVDQTLLTSVERVKSSRELIDAIDQRLARGAELLDHDVPVIDLRDAPPAP